LVEGRKMSKNEKISGTHINRRSFLKGVAATGAMGAIAAAHPLSAAQSASENKSATKSWRDKPDPIDEGLISDGGTYDIVVVGGGNAGLTCTRAAAMNGASVAVIENQAEKSYVRGVGSQPGTVNSQYALDHGAPRIDEADFLREWARRNVIRHNPRRASYFVKNSGRIMDRLIQDADKEWMAKNAHVMACPPKPTVLLEVSGWKFYYGAATFRGDLSNRTSTSGLEPWSEFLRIHQEKAMADGAKWFCEHHAEICDLDSSGAVTGVVAKRADGKYVRFKARKGVALCAGDFGGNREMVIDIMDTIRHQAEAQGDFNLVKAGLGFGLIRDGSGIKLGIWAGGHIEIGPHSCIGDGDPGAGVWYLQLDHNGERFHDEAAGTTLPQPKGSVRVTLYDANWKTALEMMPPRHMGPDTAEPYEWSLRLTHLDNVKPGPPSKDKQASRIRYGLPGVEGTTCCGNTIEELLDYMDCYKGDTRKKALAEIKRYNELCEKGIDEDFGKDRRILKVTALKYPPFYGTVSTYSSGMFGLGTGMSATTGLDTDADGHVLNSDFKPIKGLYAAGNNAGGRFITVYQSPIAGVSMGMAITEGFMLGERLADL
jgi:fumarate reductase flavoprotein subunit